jgi:membrane associated rhomboid family serine protease
VTFVLIAINILVYIGLFTIPGFDQQVAFAKYYQGSEFGSILRVITSGFAHDTSDVLHILFNMYSLYVLGTIIEPMIGKLRFVLLYMLSIFGGGLGVLYLAEFGTSVVGASGAIFGLMGAYLVLLRALKLDASQMYVLIGINLVLGFLPGIAWQAHVGGLIVGGVIALMYAGTRRREKQPQQITLIVGLVVFLGALWVLANENLALM